MSGHKRVWAQSCVGTIVSGHKCVWAQSCLGTNVCGTNVSGHNRVWAQSCVGTIVSGHKRVWAQSCLGTIVCGHNRVGSIMYGPNRGGTVSSKSRPGVKERQFDTFTPNFWIKMILPNWDFNLKLGTFSIVDLIERN